MPLQAGYMFLLTSIILAHLKTKQSHAYHTTDLLNVGQLLCSQEWSPANSPKSSQRAWGLFSLFILVAPRGAGLE